MRISDWSSDVCSSDLLRVAGGLGTIARIVSDNQAIYREKLDFTEVKRRIDSLYWPFHRDLRGLLDDNRRTFGSAILIDCHSMPSHGSSEERRVGKEWGSQGRSRVRRVY